MAPTHKQPRPDPDGQGVVGGTLRGGPNLRLLSDEVDPSEADSANWRNRTEAVSISDLRGAVGVTKDPRSSTGLLPQAVMTSTLAPGLLLGEGKYELLSPLGQGAMGSVWLARHVALDRMVAVKLLHSGLQLGRSLASTQARRDNASERFLKEARTASLLRHKNTVQLLDYGADTQDRWLVMEYLEGKNLSDELYEAGRFPAPRAIAIVSQVLASLAEAHDFGIVHRDLKPANIMLVPWVDDDGRETELVKILDFGIATMMSDEVADRNEVAGTPEYMSPEQAQAFDVDPRSDLYAVGVLLYHLLTGETPFSRDTPMQTMLAQVNDLPVPPRGREPSISLALEAIVLAALEKDPWRRPESARAMRATLLALPEARGLKPASSPRLDPVTVMAVPTSPATSSASRGMVTEGPRPEKRSRGLLWGGLGAMVAIAAVLVFILTRPDPETSPTAVAELATSPAPSAPPTQPAPGVAGVEAPSQAVQAAAPAPPTPAAPEQPTPVAAAQPTAEAAAPPTPAAAEQPIPAAAQPTTVVAADAVPSPPKERTPPKPADRAPAQPKNVAAVAKVEPAVATVAKVENPVAKVENPVATVENPVATVAKVEVPVAPVGPVVKVEPATAPSLSAAAAITSLSTRGSLPRSSAARALDSSRAGLEACYQAGARAAGRDQAGSIAGTVVYDTDGKVSSVKLSAFPLAGVSDCVNQALWRTRLRERPDTGSVDATFRIVFSPR